MFVLGCPLIGVRKVSVVVAPPAWAWSLSPAPPAVESEIFCCIGMATGVAIGRLTYSGTTGAAYTLLLEPSSTALQMSLIISMAYLGVICID